MPPTAPVPAPGRYDARRATRTQYAQLLADHGWSALFPEDREWLDRLYWGDVEPGWPFEMTLVHHDPLGEAGDEPVDVPTMGDGRSSIRIAPIAYAKADPEPLTRTHFGHFLRFWTWWLKARPGLVKDGSITLNTEDLSGAPLIKVVVKGAPERERTSSGYARQQRIMQAIADLADAGRVITSATLLEEVESDAPESA